MQETLLETLGIDCMCERGFTHQQLIHFCFNRSFLRALSSLTLLLVLGALLLFALFLRLGAFQKKVIGFDI